MRVTSTGDDTDAACVSLNSLGRQSGLHAAQVSGTRRAAAQVSGTRRAAAQVSGTRRAAAQVSGTRRACSTSGARRFRCATADLAPATLPRMRRVPITFHALKEPTPGPIWRGDVRAALGSLQTLVPV